MLNVFWWTVAMASKQHTEDNSGNMSEVNEALLWPQTTSENGQNRKVIVCTHPHVSFTPNHMHFCTACSTFAGIFVYDLSSEAVKSHEKGLGWSQKQSLLHSWMANINGSPLRFPFLSSDGNNSSSELWWAMSINTNTDFYPCCFESVIITRVVGGRKGGCFFLPIWSDLLSFKMRRTLNKPFRLTGWR